MWGTAGFPDQICPLFTLQWTNDFPLIRAPSSIKTWGTTPTCPPKVTLLPTLANPAKAKVRTKIGWLYVSDTDKAIITCVCTYYWINPSVPGKQVAVSAVFPHMIGYKVVTFAFFTMLKSIMCEAIQILGKGLIYPRRFIKQEIYRV